MILPGSAHQLAEIEQSRRDLEMIWAEPFDAQRERALELRSCARILSHHHVYSRERLQDARLHERLSAEGLDLAHTDTYEILNRSVRRARNPRGRVEHANEKLRDALRLLDGRLSFDEGVLRTIAFTRCDGRLAYCDARADGERGNHQRGGRRFDTMACQEF